MFVIWATLKGEYGVAVGSTVGACTLLVTLGYGSIILVATTRLSRKPVKVIELSRGTQIDAIYLLVTAIIALVLAWEGDGLDLKDAAVLTVIFLCYVYHHFKAAKHFAGSTESDVTRRQLWIAAVQLTMGGIIIVVLSERFVDAMLHLAKWAGVHPIAVAIVLSPIASELPEKMTAYFTVMRDARNAEISICNFIGSKVNHNSFLLAMMPLFGLVRGKSDVHDIVGLPFIMMTVFTIVATVSLSRRKLAHWEGWMFLAMYAGMVTVAFLVR